MRRSVMVLVVCVLAAFSAHARTHFLKDQWVKGGDRFCEYDDGTVLNVGAKVCPVSINK